MSGPFVVACIPAYNEERSIAGVLVQTLPYVDRIVVCDDGSSDLTAKIAEGLGAMVVRHEKNLGKGAALKSAFNLILERARRAHSEDYKILEVPVCIKYDDLEKTSNKNAVSHGTELLISIIKLIVEERPLSTLGISGSVTLLLGISSGAYFLWYFNSTRYFSIPMALLSLGGILLGMMLIITSLILYSMTEIKKA